MRNYFDALLRRASRNTVLVIALIFAIAIGVVDRYTTPDLLILYLGPIILAAWYGGIRAGMVTAIYCAMAGFFTILLAANHDANLGQFYRDQGWSVVARTLTYLFVAQLVAKLQWARNQQNELTQFIVHDLRSPIASSITGLMTLETMNDGMSLDQKEMVELALVSNHRALTLVTSILDVSKLETGKMVIRKEDVDIHELFATCIEQVGLWANTSNVKIETDITTPTAHLDSDLTQRVIVNLISNALKYSPPGGIISVTATPTGRDTIRFGVHDQGPGIPQDYAETIFEPFVQVKGTKGGTGLGLTFCRLAVHAQGGKIWVESAVGKGTSMLFSLAGQPVPVAEPVN